MPTRAAPTVMPFGDLKAPTAKPKGVAGRSRAAVRKALKGDQRSAVDKAVDATWKTAVGAQTPKQQQERLAKLRAAVAALHKAQAAAPSDPQVPAAAKALQDMTELAIREQGGPQKVTAQRPKRPDLAQLFDLHAEAATIAGRAERAQAKAEDLAGYVATGALTKKDGGYQRQSPGTQKLYDRKASGITGRAADLRFPALDGRSGPAELVGADGKRRSYAQAVDHWMHEADAAAGKKALGQLKKADGKAYDQVVARLLEERTAAAGLHPGEVAAIALYSGPDYRYTNAAASGQSGYMRIMAAEQDKAVFAGTRTTEQDDRVTEHQQARYDADRDWAAWYRQKYGKDFRTWKQRPTADLPKPKTGHDRALDQTQEASSNATRKEGLMHSGVAVGGMRKLPPWKGKVFRGEGMDSDRLKNVLVGFDQVTGPSDFGKVKPAVGTYAWPHIVSTSRARTVSEGFLAMPGNEKHKILWEIEVLDGRDVGIMSQMDAEMEVLLFPGTEVAIDRVAVLKADAWRSNDPTTYVMVHIKAHQTRPVAPT